MLICITPSIPIYVIVFDWAQSLKIKERKTFETYDLNQNIEIYVAINHHIKGKIGSLKWNYTK